MKRLFALYFALLFFSGCATVNTMDKTREELPERVKYATFDSGADKVFKAAQGACEDLKLAVYYTNEDQGKIYAKSYLRWVPLIISMGTFGFGEKIGIYVTAVDANNTKAEVVVQKANLLDVGHADWRQKILDVIKERLNNK